MPDSVQVDLQTHLERIMAERDRFYTTLFDSNKAATNAALKAQEDRVLLAFNASEKAILKQEAAQEAYNARSNEFRATLDDQAKTFVTRREAEVQSSQSRELADRVNASIVELQRLASRTQGGSESESRAKTNTQWLVALTVTVGLSIFGALGSLIFFLSTRH